MINNRLGRDARLVRPISEAREMACVMSVAWRTHEIVVHIADGKTMYNANCNADARAVRPYQAIEIIHH